MVFGCNPVCPGFSSLCKDYSRSAVVTVSYLELLLGGSSVRSAKDYSNPPPPKKKKIAHTAPRANVNGNRGTTHSGVWGNTQRSLAPRKGRKIIAPLWLE